MSPAIEIQGLSKRFGAFQALTDISLLVPSGTCCGLIGPNGAGKTTLFGLMCGYLKPSAGSLRILGANPQIPGSLKHVLSVLPQDAALPSAFSVTGFLCYMASLSSLPDPKEAARKALAQVGLSDVGGRRCNTLSHGMAKRIALAQTMLGDPPLVLLDEPTAGLDPASAQVVRTLILELRSKRTIVVSSHNLQELEDLCDMAVLMDKGRIVEAKLMSDFTGASAEFRVSIARGTVPLDLISAQPQCREAKLEDESTLYVRFEGAAEDIITTTASILASRQVQFTEIWTGRRLDDAVLETLRRGRA